MPNEPAEFRDRLLGAQEMTPALRAQHQKDLDAIFYCKLTARTRALTWTGLIAAIAFAALILRGLIFYHSKPGVIFIFPAYLAAVIGIILWLARVLWQGGFARRTYYAVIDVFGGIFVGVYVTAALINSMCAPSEPSNLVSAIWALMLLTTAFAWGTGNRITGAALETRAQLLRMESRLADLAERLQK